MSDPDAAPPSEPRRARGGFTVREYEARVWDMARHLLHPTGLYVLAVVAGVTRLAAHEVAERPGTGVAVQAAWFACGFLGAWACFWSTLLRDAGLPSRAVTILVPLAALTALALWTVAPAPASLGERGFWGASAALVGPGPLAFAFTWRQWRKMRREHAHLLPEGER